MIVDAHQHFWRLERGDYTFPSRTDPILYRDFLPPDLAPIVSEAEVDGTILVQATETIAESHFLFGLAAETPWVAGVVGWWDPRGGAGSLDALMASPDSDVCVGVRPMLQRYDEAAWLLEPASLDELQSISERGLTFDALVDVRHLAVIAELARIIPTLRIVIDHMGKPWRTPDRFSDWADGISLLATRPNCRVKVSGFPFGAAGNASPADLPGLIDHLQAQFGVERLVWGSDWPVVEREGGYLTALSSMQQHFSSDEGRAVFGANARDLYTLARWTSMRTSPSDLDRIAPSTGRDS